MGQDGLVEFLSRNNISNEDWVSTGLKWDELSLIATNYEKEIPHLEAAAALLANIIQKFDSVHSVRWRVKDKDHLLYKIFRKCFDNIDKYKNISENNYREIVTDLIGIRAMHLFKDDIYIIDKAVTNIFSLRETAVVYVRKGDDEQFIKLCEEKGFEVEAHPKGYRSIHYVISTQPLKQPIYVELQVRTIFEEGWSEIDHMVRYPNYSNDPRLAYLLTIFNRMAGSADEIGGFVRTLAEELDEMKVELNNSLANADALVNQLDRTDEGSKDEQITALRRELEKLKASQNSIWPTPDSLGILELPVFPRIYVDADGVIRRKKKGSRAFEEGQGILKYARDPAIVETMQKGIPSPEANQAMLIDIKGPRGGEVGWKKDKN